MPAVWKSTHPEVLAWWADAQKRDKRYVRECKKVEKKFGRGIILRTGFGDDRVMGLSRTYSEDPLPGWKLGWGKRTSGFMEPRHSGRSPEEKAACKEAQELITRLDELRPSVRSEAHEKFGTPVFQMFGMHVISPGFFEHDGVLWMTFGTHDYEPPEEGADDNVPEGRSTVRDYFTPAKKSEYYAAREAAGLEEVED